MPNLDLDSYIKEQQEDPFSVTLGGKEFTIPFDVPAFAFQKFENMSSEDVGPETMGEILSLAFGEDQFKEMRKAGLTPGGMLESKVFFGAMEHMAKSITGESDMGKLIEMAENRTNGTKPRKVKAKRSR